ncbi:hypothetical protein J6590_067439 [Homalodisca vitripennis]|nr:hypothetical protein J6590_067439 [Homalodisca vitripennis]
MTSNSPTIVVITQDDSKLSDHRRNNPVSYVRDLVLSTKDDSKLSDHRRNNPVSYVRDLVLSTKSLKLIVWQYVNLKLLSVVSVSGMTPNSPTIDGSLEDNYSRRFVTRLHSWFDVPSLLEFSGPGEKQLTQLLQWLPYSWSYSPIYYYSCDK